MKSTLERFKNLYRNHFEPELLEEINQIGNFKTLAQDHILIEPGQYLRSVPLIIDGTIKIIRVDEDQNELLLYFINTGETCAMALSCCIGHTKSEIKAVAETEVELITIPIQKMEEWSSKYKSWRNFVLKSYHHQLMDAFNTIDIIAFARLDERLKIYLKNKQKIAQKDELIITHQEIANDLNSSRVVISRLLKKMEKEHQIALGHNLIKIIHLG